MLRLVGILLVVILVGSGSGSGAAFAAAVEPAAPLDRAQPSYPESAGTATGHVKVQFTIDADGRVQDLQVLESDPPGVFDAAALDAMKNWRYRPRRIDGVAAVQTNNIIALHFVPAPPEEPQYKVELARPVDTYYTREAFEKKLEGDVTLAFDIDEFGFVEHPHVEQGGAGGAFDQQAISALKNTHFRAPLVNGVPTGVMGLSVTLPLRLATAEIAPKPVYEPRLSYPKEAQDNRLQGYCEVVQTIAEDGSVEKAEVTDTLPGIVFKRHCEDFAMSFKFEPLSSFPAGHVSNEHRLIIQFKLDGSRSLLKPGQWVKLRYTVGTEGQMKDVEVAEASGPDVRTQRVLDVVRKRRVQPVIENGVAVEKPNRFIIVRGDDP